MQLLRSVLLNILNPVPRHFCRVPEWVKTFLVWSR